MNLKSMFGHRGSSAAKNAASGFQRTFALYFLLAIHILVLLAAFIAPYSFDTQARLYPYAPPTHVHLFDCQGKFHPRPFVYVTKVPGDTQTGYMQDCSQPAGVHLLVRGDE